MANKPPKRSDFPAGKEGMAQFQKALAIYQRTGAAGALGLPSKSGKQIGTDVKVDDLKKSNIRIQKASTRGKGLQDGTTYKKGGYINPKSNKRKGESWSNRDNQYD